MITFGNEAKRWGFSVQRLLSTLLRFFSVLLFFCLLVPWSTAHAGPGQEFLDSLHGNFHVAECCSTTLSRCVEKKPDCEIADRLMNFTTWMKGLRRSSDEKIAEALKKRYLSLTSDSTFQIDTARWPTSGDPDAPVIITEYYSANCPMCKFTYKELYAAVTEGPLKGKARLLAKPLTTGIGDRALEAAHRMGRFSDFLLIMEKQRGRPTEKNMTAIADSLGLDRKKFGKLLGDKELKGRILESRREAKRNGVQVTPTFFIQNKRYRSHKASRWVIDAAEFFYEKTGQSGKGKESR